MSSVSVVIQPQLGDTIRIVREVMLRLNEPKKWYRRCSSLLRVNVTPPGLRSSDQLPYSIEVESRDSLTGELSRVVSWLREGKGGLKDAKPPTDAIVDLCRNPDHRLPELEAVVTTPFFSGAKFICAEGYHAEERVLFVPVVSAPEGAALPCANPTPEQVTEAVRFLRHDLLGDFPFKDEASFAHTIAAMLVQMTRRIYPATPTPLFAIGADKPGSGKTLLANIMSIVATGRVAPPSNVSFGGSFNDAETRRVLTSVLRPMPEVVLFDNVREDVAIDSPAFASALTATRWSDRLVGTSTSPDVPVGCLWTLTGNSPAFSAEVARRSLYIFLDPATDQPESRNDFKQPNLIAWTRDNRFSILVALWTLVFAWARAGKPHGRTPMGSYEEFARVVGGILENAGIRGFKENDADKRISEPQVGVSKPVVDLLPSLERWWKTYGARRQRADTLVGVFTATGLVPTSQQEQGRSRSQLAHVGRLLRPVIGKQVGQYRVNAINNAHTKGKEYWLTPAEGTPTTLDLNLPPGPITAGTDSEDSKS